MTESTAKNLQNQRETRRRELIHVNDRYLAADRVARQARAVLHDHVIAGDDIPPSFIDGVRAAVATAHELGLELDRMSIEFMAETRSLFSLKRWS